MTETLKSNKIQYQVGIGIMSGTSLDGIDIAACSFKDSYTFDLIDFKGIAYSTEWKAKLEKAPTLNGIELRLLEIEYSEFIADQVKNFLGDTAITPDFIACHGHTIFHQPDKKLTCQILDGSVVAAKTKITTVCDFRSGDVALGGQGAPLVPIGDKVLFRKYEACLNLGGIANLSFEQNGIRKAYDIGPANLLLNKLAGREGLDYDKDGDLARSGKIIAPLLHKLNSLDYYTMSPPKSLGREWLEEHVFPLFTAESTADLLATSIEHIASQIATALNETSDLGLILATGGGAHNTFLMEMISGKTKSVIEIPSQEIIDAKEAIIFALLGKLRLENKINTLASVTGASRDSCGGAVYLGC